MKKNRGIMYYIYHALGGKSHPDCNETSDKVALIRMLIFLSYLITNIFIVSGVVRHWNSNQEKKVEVVYVIKI